MADEFREQRGVVRKTWWVTRFTLAAATLGQFDFGVAAFGNGKAQFDRAVRKAAELQRLGEQGTGHRPSG